MAALSRKEFLQLSQASRSLAPSKMRPSWDVYFMAQAMMVARRSACIRRQVGAILVNNKQVLSTGYNGPPTDFQHATTVGCYRDIAKIPSATQIELCRGIHAEQNAIALAAKKGISIAGSTLYCTHSPCITCLKLLIAAGITKIYYYFNYPDTDLILDEALELGTLEYQQLDAVFLHELTKLLDQSFIS